MRRFSVLNPSSNEERDEFFKRRAQARDAKRAAAPAPKPKPQTDALTDWLNDIFNGEDTAITSAPKPSISSKIKKLKDIYKKKDANASCPEDEALFLAKPEPAGRRVNIACL